MKGVDGEMGEGEIGERGRGRMHQGVGRMGEEGDRGGSIQEGRRVNFSPQAIRPI